MEEQKPTNSIPFAIMVAGMIIAGTIFFINKSPFQPPAIATGDVVIEDEKTSIPPELYILAKDDHILGNPDAPITIFEYSDFQCPFCQRYQIVLKKIMEQYGVTGEVALVYRHFPLEEIHQQAKPLAIASECAYAQGGDAAFWKAHYFIMEQDIIFDVKDLSSTAKAAQVDAIKFQECVNAGSYSDRVDRDFIGGVNAGIAGAPVSLVHHKDGRTEIFEGLPTYAELSEVIESFLLHNPAGVN